MKKITSSLFIILVSISISSQVFAYSYTILDDAEDNWYIGGNSDNPGNVGTQEIAGEPDKYSISQMDVDISGTTLTIDIWSQYFDNIGYHNTYLGDLFISTTSLDPDGWDPEGVQPWNTDVLAGEIWEYVLVFNYDRYTQYDTVTSGTASLYKVDEGGTIITPADQGPTYTPSYYRAGQEIYYDPADGQTVYATANWTINGLGTSPDTDDYLQYLITFDFGVSNPKDFAFHWTMTCANDVIEGNWTNELPEPATAMLFGMGFMPFAVNLIRRKKK